MIVELAQEVQQLIEEIDELENSKHIADDMQATLDALLLLMETVNRLQSLLQLIYMRISDEELQKVFPYSARCATLLQRSAAQFESQPRQVKELQLAIAQAQEALSALQGAWKRYAKERVREPLELYRLVGHLLEVIAQHSTYEGLRQQLEAHINHEPMSPNQLHDFDQSLEQFASMIARIEGLSEVVKAFLLNTLSGTATLADVTGEVLQWCHQGRRARAFSIHFAR